MGFNSSVFFPLDNGECLLEETPYLEIICNRSQCDGQHDEPVTFEEGQGLEKQGSLIAAAWSDINEAANQDLSTQSPPNRDQVSSVLFWCDSVNA